MRPRLLILPLLAAACAAPFASPPHPLRAEIGGTRMDVQFSDGRTCRVEVPMTGGEGGFGPACPQDWHWQVTVRHRNWLEPIFGAAVSPYADILLIGPEGATARFRVPYTPDHGY
ncbi:MAG: hypothetical protein JSR87_11175 [Proteobacteria bacterium]|nr:hypothetical protein [Pseudomonadota bacterium]